MRSFGKNSRLFRQGLGSTGLLLRSFPTGSIYQMSTHGLQENNKSFKKKLISYSQLAKFRLSSLVVLTSGAGYMCYGGPVDIPTLIAACTGTGLCAASANTFNQIVEKDHDAKMFRTRARPLPSGRCTPAEASFFGVSSGLLGVSTLYAMTNPVVAALGAANIALYAGLYTYSKRKSEINTWIGAVVGAIPPVMGWAAASGGMLATAEPVALASILFLWQFPHFFALSWMHREDYARGGFQMVPVNDADGTRTAALIQEYSLYLTALPIIASAAGLTSYMFALEGTTANMYLLYQSYRFKQEKSNANAKNIFLCSLWYLPVLLAGYVFHSRQWNKDENTIRNGSDQIAEAVISAKEFGKSVCLHCSQNIRN